MRAFICIFLLVFGCKSSVGQSNLVDSLLLVIKTSSSKKKVITAKANVIYKLFSSGKKKEAIQYYKECLADSKAENYTKALPTLYLNYGNIQYLLSNIDSSSHYYLLSLDNSKKEKDSIIQVKALNNLGTIDFMYGKYETALKSYNSAAQLEKEYGYAEGNIVSISNIAKIYWALDMVPQAHSSFLKAFKKYEADKNYGSLTFACDGLCDTYMKLGKSDSAVYFGLKNIEYSELSGDLYNLGYAYNSLGILYNQLRDLEEAKRSFQKGLKISKKINDKRLEMSLNCNLGYAYELNGESNLSGECFKQVIRLQKTHNIPIDRKDIYKFLAHYSFVQKDYKSAYGYLKLFNKDKDSLFGIEISQQIAELSAKYETEKKEKLNLLLKKENESNSREIKAQKATRNYLVIIIALCGLVIAGSVIVFKKIRKVNSELSVKNDAINEKNIILEDQKKEILDSIHYAKRIQTTILAHSDFLNVNLPQNFVLFKPKDIVSGDFYWATKKDHLFYLAVCDSTGHGVPGAFMSLLNIGFLSEAINEKNITEPHKVFNYVRERLIESVNKEGQKDGFDGILMCFDQKTKEITYAAAYNAPVLVLNGKIVELEKDKMPVGIGEKKQSFNLYNVKAEKNSTLYIYTDGYADQFGGPKGKKFLYKRLNDLLLSIHKKDLSGQKNEIEQEFENWRGVLEQVDDVLMIGVKI